MDEVLKRLEEYYHGFLHASPRIAMAVLIFVGGILLSNWITSLAKKGMYAKAHDKLMAGFLSKALKVVLIIVIFLFTLKIAGLGNISAALLATFGASAVVLGFAFKDIVENFLAGIILAFNRPFELNDSVEVEGVFGRVKKMEFRYTKIETFDGRDVYIPNSDVLTKPVYNFTEDGFFRTDFIVGIAYEDDPQKAKDIIMKTLEEYEDLVHDDAHINFVAEDELAASTVNLKVFIWVSTADFRRGMLETRGNAIARVKKALEENGFNLPSDIRELKVYNASSPFPIELDKQNGRT